jgi:hypothetical protein
MVRAMTDRPPKPENAARLAREAAALRENLRKRKAQGLGRAEGGGADAAAAGPQPAPLRPESA